MKFFQLLKCSLVALKHENELELAYLYGQKLDQETFLKNKKIRFSGIFFRVLVFFRFLWVNLKIKNKKINCTHVLFFAGTDNQFNSLRSTFEAHRHNNLTAFLIGQNLSYKNSKIFDVTEVVSFSFSLIFIAIILFVIKAPRLYWHLKKGKRTQEIDSYFNVFCQSYTFLPYFLKWLSISKPSLVILSNDHNVPNRSLKLAAEILGIKTLYMQHASVSELFPPLEFDYALLDGRHALDTYTRCFQTLEAENVRILRNISKCKIILSGQKKLVAISTPNKKAFFVAGVAVNELDDFEKVEKVLYKFVDSDKTCILRTHPLQTPAFLEKLKVFIALYPDISWSNSKEESLIEYFSKVEFVIAGNTSLHLEAALAGLPTFYLEMSEKVHLPDYYGYVKNGLSIKLEKNFLLGNINNSIENLGRYERHQAIKNYSETYKTPWQNREGELSALIIDSILKNHKMDEIFKYENTGLYQSVASLID